VEKMGLSDTEENHASDETEEIQWSSDHNWSQLENDYTGSNKPVDSPVETLKGLVRLDQQRERSLQEINIDDLNEGQRQFYDILTTILGYNEGESCTDGGSGFSRLIFLRGQGGTGKSTCVNAVRAQLDPMHEAVIATTGKAATVVGGSTVFNKKNGLALPVKAEFSHLQQGPSLIRLQQKYRFTKVLFLDECSMLHQKQLYFMDQRLRQIKANDSPFGGIAIVLIGDTGQLPAVKGRVLWDNKPSTSEIDTFGKNLYHLFTTVVNLEKNVWIDPNDDEAMYYDEFFK
jgi:hypothetical protein